MSDIFLLVGDYLQGKSIYPPARRLLNLLFNISIASFIYERVYGSYEWMNYNDYKGILNFFIKGNFFIPLSIFIITYSITQFTSIVIFWTINHFKTLKWTRNIIHYEVKKEIVEERFRELNQSSKLLAPSRITKSKLTELYTKLRAEIPANMYEELSKGLKEPKEGLENNFHMMFRSVIAITIYFITLTHFGWGLYLIVIAILLSTMYAIMIAYRFLDVLPVLVRKLHTIAEDFLKAD